MLQLSRMGRVLTSVSMATAWVVALALALPSVAQADDPPHVVFVTSVSGTGDLGSWPEAAAGTVGVNAADSICQSLALAAGLNNPLDFVAWLSDSDDDAYCRVHGVTGKKSTNCDGATLAWAGPWVRTDGYPFAPTINRILDPNGEVYVPLEYDENGQAVGGAFFTGTYQSGEASNDLCTDSGTLTDWASSAGAGRVGSTFETGWNWTNAYIGSCSTAQRLLCMEKGNGGPLPPFAQAGRLVFVTSASGPGELGAWPEADPGTSGIAAGDSICRNLADAARLPLPEEFRAWLSDSMTDARDRFVEPGPWVRVDGVVVFPSTADMTTSGLFTGLNVTETGAYISYQRSWTGTWSNGTADSNNCNDWLDGSSGFHGRLGLCSSTTVGWTANTSFGCDWDYRLYCFGPDIRIFEDGFESGDTTAW